MRPAQSIEHPCLVRDKGQPPQGEPLTGVETTDRSRLALTLQAAGLLAHLNRARWKLVGGLDRGIVDAGVLTGLLAQPGRDETPVHQHLRGFLLHLFDCDTEIVGRGQARRSARKLTSAWGQPLAPLSTDEILCQILHHASFLWADEFAIARRGLFAVVDGKHPPRAVGPASFCLRVERKLTEGREVDDVVGSPDFRSAWEGATAVNPVELAQDRRWAEAVSTFRVNGVRGDEERLLFASSLQAMGKFEQTLEVIARVGDRRAELIRLHCLSRLQRLESARRLLLKLQERRLPPRELVDAGDIALRVFRNLGDMDRVEEWRARLSRIRSEEIAPLARVSLVGAAFDAGDVEQAEELLQSDVSLRSNPHDGWRWHYADGLCGLGRADGVRAEHAFRTALIEFRRRLSRVRATLLWTNLVSSAELRGDLLAAERAARTAYRLGMGFEGPIRNSIFLYNLAEVLLKRGKVDGVRELLDEVAWTDRSVGHRRGIVQDAELKARYHLTRGRPDRTLRVVDEVLKEHEDEPWRRPELLAWSARALGLMGRSRDAAERLRLGGAKGLAIFDAEEIPAIWSLAGKPEQALAIVEGPAADLWAAVINGQPPPEDRWESLDFLDAYPAARLVRDLELSKPGCVARHRRVKAVRTLRQLGLERVAQEIERIPGGAWSAVNAYLDGETGGDLNQLFSDAGYGDVRVEWDGPDAEVLIPGPGGDKRHAIEAGLGQLVVDADAIDEPLLVLLALARQEVERRRTPYKEQLAAPGGIVGNSAALRSALRDVRLLARSDLPILILGETGTGKELVARWAHAQSDRDQSPFLAVNCAAISDSLRNSELFGHAKGAFTGADQERAGYFEAASGGTIFLDEIGDLSLDAQGGLLRVLQEKEIMRVGESRTRRIDTRVVAATHRNLREMLDDGVFRQDLYYRLNQSLIELPPLRERGDDIVTLARHFLAIESTEAKPLSLTREAINRLQRHPWPGNVRELHSVIRTAALFAEDGRIGPAHLRLEDEPPVAVGDLQAEVADFRRRRILEELERAGGKQADAARALGMTRQGLSYWIKKSGAC